MTSLTSMSHACHLETWLSLYPVRGTMWATMSSCSTSRRVRRTCILLTSEANALSGVDPREIARTSLVNDGNKMAVLVATYKSYPGLVTASWDLVSTNVYFKESNTLFDGLGREPMIKFLKCRPTGSYLAECYFDAEDITDYWYEITFNSTLTQDPIVATRKIWEIELPPSFDIQKVDKTSDYLAILVKKHQTNQQVIPSRILQIVIPGNVDKYTNCNNLILLYKPGFSKYVYSGITCTEFLGNPLLDMAIEQEGTNHYVYFTTLDPTNKLMINTFQAPIVYSQGQDRRAKRLRLHIHRPTWQCCGREQDLHPRRLSLHPRASRWVRLPLEVCSPGSGWTGCPCSSGLWSVLAIRCDYRTASSLLPSRIQEY
jgi:hypothetical protein